MEKQKQPASTSRNHEKAPKSAAFVKAMRALFGADQVQVLCVEEGEVKLGERQ